MGKTIAELERDLGDGEIEEWMAFHFFEPFGAPADDDRFRLLSTLLWEFNAKAGSTMPDWLDRDPEETARRREINGLLTMDDDAEAFFSAIAVKSKDKEVLPPPPPLDEPVAPSALNAVKSRRKPRKKPVK